MELPGGASSHLRTPTEREQHRQYQYKSGGRSSTPEWRNSYRKRCTERLQKSRERLISRFRHMKADSGDTSQSPGDTKMEDSNEDPVALSVKEAMKQEWELMREQNSDLPRVLPLRKRISSAPDPAVLGGCKRRQPYCIPSSDDEYEQLDYVLSIIDELTQELILEEQAMLDQYQERQVEMDLRLFEEDSLCAAIDSLSACGNVMCPICQRNFLFQDVRSIYCECGLQINTIHDGLTLAYLQQQLEACVTQHSGVCDGKPIFSMECNLGIQNIIMNCSVCDFMFIVV